jgi:hypothetical protein
MNTPGAKPSNMPVVAAILAVLGFCFPPFFLVAMILAIIAVAKGDEPAFAARKTMAIVVLVVTPMAGFMYIPFAGIVAAIAIPNFIKFQARSKQTECKTNLKAAFLAQKAYFAQKQTWGTSADEIGFSPDKTRYLYRIGPDSVLLPRMPDIVSGLALEGGYPDGLLEQAGSHGDCPDKCVLTMLCAGNVDNDPGIDVWSVSSEQRTIGGEVIPAGTPFNDRNDVTGY